MKIDKDEREWAVRLLFSSKDCPHLYYPANLYACHLLDKVNAPDIRCRKEICPMRIEETQ